MENTWHYRQKAFAVLGDVICMLLSSLVPSISILVLCFQKSLIARLCVITAMCFICSVIMTFIVRGRRVIFSQYRQLSLLFKSFFLEARVTRIVPQLPEQSCQGFRQPRFTG